ncbi:MAG TPA: hypothetical protein VHU77_09620 [Candidatus Limnocylindria bacterium]|nr:hypothetical protein [Candidatus Limnocylindria bacterium]
MAVGLGIWGAGWLYGLLPPLIIDRSAVGGAATASGVALLILGIGHLAAAALTLRAIAATAVVGLTAVMAALSLGWGVAAVVSAASGSGPAALLLPGGIVLVGVAVGYAWTARLVAVRRARGRPRS